MVRWAIVAYLTACWDCAPDRFQALHTFLSPDNGGTEGGATLFVPYGDFTNGSSAGNNVFQKMMRY